MTTRQIQKAILLTASWQEIARREDNRIGVLLQNQSANGTKKIFISAEGGATEDFAAIELPVGGNLYEDIVPPSGSIWAKSDSDATLTAVMKYPG